MKKIIGLLTWFIFATQLCFGAWDASKPADNEKLKDTPALIRANWSAIATGTDSALQITNAKVSATAGIVDTKLDTISTAGKVSGTAITGLASLPAGAGAVPILNGGTGQTTKEPALNALLPTQTGLSGKTLKTDGSTHSWGYPTDLAIASQAQGDLLYFNGTSWVRLGAGTAGYILKTQGVGANPAWLQTLPTANGGTGATADANSANGVCVLDSNARVATANLGSGTASSSNYLRGDQSWSTISSGANVVASGTYSFTNSTITISSSLSSTKFYRLYLTLYGPTTTDEYGFRFNGDTNARYYYQGHGLKGGGTEDSFYGNPNNDYFLFAGASDNNHGLSTVVDIFPATAENANYIYFTFNTFRNAANNTDQTFWAGGGMYAGVATLSSVSFYCNTTCSGRYTLIEMAQ
jgi:hypothetical protein